MEHLILSNKYTISQIATTTLYGCGVVIYSIYNSYWAGIRELEAYKSSCERKSDTKYISAYSAFWSGCKYNILWGAVDALTWPAQVFAYVVYLYKLSQ